MSKALLLLVMMCPLLHGGASVLDPLGWIKSQVDSARGLYVSFGDDNQQLLARLKQEKVAFDDQEERVEDTIKSSLEKISQQLLLMKDRRESRSESAQRKSTLLNEMQQTLIDIQLTRKQIALSLEQQIKELEEYLKDPEFKNLVLDTKVFYSFENFQAISQKLADESELIQHLEEQKSNLSVDLENRIGATEQLEKEYRSKEHELKEGSSELLELNVKLLSHKRKLMEQKVIELKRRLALLDTKLVIERAKRKMLEDQRSKVKEGLKVAEHDVAAERAALEKKRQSYLETKDSLYTERKNRETEREKLKQNLEEYARALNITICDLRSLDEMAIEPRDVKGYYQLAALLNIKEQILVLDKRIELLDAQIKLVDTRFDKEKQAVESIASWHKLTMRRFRSEAEVEAEIAKYQTPLKEADLAISSLSEKRNTATNFLSIQNKAVDSLKQRVAQLNAHQNLFKEFPVEYYQTAELLRGAIRLAAHDQIGINRKIIEIYANTIALTNELKNNIHIIMGELQSIGLRPSHAISLSGVRNILSDLQQVRIELFQIGADYCRQFSWAWLWSTLQDLGFLGVLWLLIKLLTLLLIYVVCKLLLPLFGAFVHRVTRDAGRGLLVVGRFVEGVVEFAQAHYTALFLWVCAYAALHWDVVPELFPRIIFYLASIPFALWLGLGFLQFFISYNAEQGYLFVNDQFVGRIAWVIRILLYATCTIFFFREAFMLTSYTRSELPTILLALYSVIVRIVLISCIRKEDILEIIPERGVLWTWARSQVEEHFYSVFAAIVALLILSEPHIGFGKQVSYILWGLIGTALLVRGVMLLHEFIKRTSSLLFFVSEGEYRERFAHAQKLYGIFIIAVFVLIGFLGVIIGARIWGYSITYNDLYDLFNKELFALGEGTIDRREISLLSILQLLTYLFGSFVVAWAVNQLILRRIYDLLIVESGVQHTVSTIVHYLIVLSIIMLGFQRIGLGKVVPILLLSLALAIYWPLRDHVNDFVSYFIILVQRPFKIGDLVTLDDKVHGVVRKITPRSIILREKNSTTVLLPNSKVITGTISNWNYVRSFVATPDIFVSVGYAHDPQEVKVIMHRVLDASMHVLKNPRPVIRLEDFGEQGYVFLVRPYLSPENVPQRQEIASDVRFAFVKALREKGIDILPPAQILRMKSE